MTDPPSSGTAKDLMQLSLQGVAHGLWRALPHRARRQALDRVLGRLAPTRTRVAWPLTGPWTVAGVLGAPTGLGESARLTLMALQALGERTHAVDLTAMMRQPSGVTPPAAPPAETGGGTLLVFVQPPFSSLALRLIGRARLAGKRLIAYWVWEREVVPARWVRHVDPFHDVVAPSRFAAQALAAALGREVRTVPFPVAVSRIPRAAADEGRPFTVGFVGDVMAAAERKNPLGALEAFDRAELGPSEARLRLFLHGGPTMMPALAERIAAARARGLDVAVEQRVRGDSETKAIYRDLDLYLSLHRAEGFGLTVAEAMLAGVPAVATDWSATSELVTPETGYPVPATLVPAPPTVDDPVARRWAEPDLDAAARLIRAAWADPADRARRGAAARRAILSGCSAATFLAALTAADPAG